MGMYHERIVKGSPAVIIIVGDNMLRRILMRYCLRLDFQIISLINPTVFDLKALLRSQNIQYTLSDSSFSPKIMELRESEHDALKCIYLVKRPQKMITRLQNNDSILEIPFTLNDLKKTLFTSQN